MDQFPPTLSHSAIAEVFTNVFFVSGAMETVLMDMDWQFSRNMIVVRDGGRLIIINSVRLDDVGLAELDQLGQVTDVMRIGSLHGRDDAFYVNRYKAEYWAIPGAPVIPSVSGEELKATQTLASGQSLPISDASFFTFNTTQVPEGILHLNRDGGILIACDALQNWLAPDEYFCDSSCERMTDMGFFTPANVGPVWLQAAAPAVDDFTRLKELKFKHALCGHGSPLKETAYQDYSATFERLFELSH